LTTKEAAAIAIKLQVRLQGPLKKYSPEQDNLTWESASEECAVAELLNRLGVPASSVSFVSVDGVKVNLNHLLKGGEQVVVYPRVSGG